MRIFTVEDDKHIRELIIYALNSNGFAAFGFETVADFYAKLETEKKPDLILLDIMLPDEDGLAALKKIRENSETSQIPVIMLTAKGSEYDKIIGLDLGADDYITKPFSVLELISRIKAVLRRAPAASPESAGVMICGGIELDIPRRSVKSGGELLTLTFKEFELLRYLMQNRGIVLSRDKLIRKIWDYDFSGESRTVDVHVKSLRKKLRENADAIETIRGVGYKFGEKV